MMLMIFRKYYLPTVLIIMLCCWFWLGAAMDEWSLPVEDSSSNDEDYSDLAPHTLSFNVVLEPLHETTIYSEVTSPILKIYKKMGDAFYENEIIMEFEKKIYLGNYNKTKAAVEKYKAEMEAKQVLYDDDSLSLFELEDSKASYASAEADFLQAEKLLDATTVRAPFKGKVVHVHVKQFELAQQGKPLIDLVDDQMLYAKFLVPSRLLPCLTKDRPIELTIRETGEKVDSHITRIAPVIDPSSSTIKIEAEINNSKGTLWPGMIGTVSLKECEK